MAVQFEGIIGDPEVVMKLIARSLYARRLLLLAKGIRVFVFDGGHFASDVGVFEQAGNAVGHVLGRYLGLAVVLADKGVLDDVVQLEEIGFLHDFVFDPFL